MNDALTREIQQLIDAGATYEDATTLGEEVLDIVDAFFARFLSYSEEQRHAHVLWCAHTQLMNCWDQTPRMLFVSPEAGCGKTRALTVTGQFVSRPDHVADLTPAAFYSSVEDSVKKGGRPTILFDEYDTNSGGREMRRLINTGHSRNGGVNRKIGGKVKKFRVYAPMALAGKMGIYDVPDTIRTRSIVIPMQKPLPGQKPERWNRRIHEAEAKPVCWLLQLWAELIYSYATSYVGPDRPMFPEGIEDRDRDVWEPLLAVAELAGGHWPERARVASVALVALATPPSDGTELLADIKAVFDRLQAKAIFTANLLTELGNMDRSWRRLDGKSLARILHGYGIETHKDQRIGATVKKGYQRWYFEDAWSRYLPPGATGATSATDEVDDDE